VGAARLRLVGEIVEHVAEPPLGGLLPRLALRQQEVIGDHAGEERAVGGVPRTVAGRAVLRAGVAEEPAVER